MMIWLILASIAMLVTGVLLYLNGKQRLAYGVIFGPILLMLTLLALSHFSGGWSDADVAADALLLRDANMTEAPGAGYRFTARVFNQHENRLVDGVQFNIQALDCTAAGTSDCTVIGETQQVIRVDIPAGQARDVSANVVFDRARLKPNHQIRWSYQVTAASTN